VSNPILDLLARFAPALLSGRSLHLAALKAAARDRVALAERLFARAAGRYAEAYDPDSNTRLRAHRRRIMRRSAGAADRVSTVTG